MREETITVRARWTTRRARRWWDHELDRLAELVADALRVPVGAIVFVEVVEPPEHSWSRRKWVFVRVCVLLVVDG